MIDDHSKAGEELKELASSKGWTVPTDMGSKHRATITKLTNASDANFDREYMHEMVMDHDHDVKLFQHYASSGNDAELKAWAQKTLPTLQEHQQMAKTTAGKVGAKTADSRDMTKTSRKVGAESSTSTQGSNTGRKMPGQTGTDSGASTTTP
jgi:putative membrane protein